MENEFIEWFKKNEDDFGCSHTDAEIAYPAWKEGINQAYKTAKKLLLAANNWVKITSNEDYTGTIEKAFDMLERINQSK